MKINVQTMLIKGVKVLAPTDQENADKMKKLDDDEVYTFNFTKIRSYEFHKKYFSLINLAFENQEFYKDVDHFRKIYEMKAGYFDAVVTDKGITYLPKSIAYDKLDQVAFEELYKKVLDKIILFLGCDEHELLNQLGSYL